MDTLRGALRYRATLHQSVHKVTVTLDAVSLQDPAILLLDHDGLTKILQREGL